MARQIEALHELAADQCPFDRGLSLMFDRAADVVGRHAVNPDFLPEEDKDTPADQLLARIIHQIDRACANALAHQRFRCSTAEN